MERMRDNGGFFGGPKAVIVIKGRSKDQITPQWWFGDKKVEDDILAE